MNAYRFAMRLGGVALGAALLASCGGAGTNPAPIPGIYTSESAAAPARSRRKLAHVGIKIVIPSRHHRRGAAPHGFAPRYLTPEVQGVSIGVTQTGGKFAGGVFYPLGVGQPGCSGGVGAQPLSCVLALQAPPGNDTFTVDTYDAPNENAYIISTATVTQTITLNALNTLNFVTSGVVVNVQLELGTPYGVPGVTSSSSILITALDGDDNMIVGPFDTPLVLSDSDTTGVTAISATSLASPADFSGLHLSYTGGALSGCATVEVETASPVDVDNGGPFNATACFQDTNWTFYASPALLNFAKSGAAAQTVTLTGVSGQYDGTPPYSITTAADRYGDPSCAGIVTVSGSSPTFTITPVGTGVCDLATFDSSGDPQGYTPLPVAVSP